MEAEGAGAGRGGAEEHTRRFADAFSSILADESGPRQKKRKKAEQGPILAHVDTSKASRAEEAAKRAARQQRKQQALRKLLRAQARTRPESNLDEREAALQKIATRGVVKLFNAVAEAQRGAEAAELETSASAKKQAAALSKDGFLNMLKGGGAAAAEAQPEREEGAGAPNWDVLKDDYGMEHTKLKHWDDDGDESSSEDERELEQEEEEEEEEESEEEME